MNLDERQRSLPQQLQQQILSDLPCGLCFARDDDRLSFVYANESFFRMFGYDNAIQASAEGMFGAIDGVDDETRKQLLTRLQSLKNGKESITSLEALLHRRDGSEFWSMIKIRRSEAGDGIWLCAFMDITAQKRVEDELRMREEEYRIAVRQSDKIVIRLDIEKKMAYLPPESAEMFQKDILYNVPESIESAGVVIDESLNAFHDMYQKIVSGRHSTGSAVLQLRLNSDGSTFDWYRVIYSLIYRADSTPAQAVISLENVSEQHAWEVAYQRWEQTYQSMPQKNTAYLEFDLTQNRLEVQKGALLEELPCACGDTMEGVLRYYLEHCVHPEDRERVRLFTAREHLLTEYFRGVRMEKPEYRHLRPDGRYGWVRLSVQMLPDPYSRNVRASFLLRDIDTQKQEELNLKVQLRTDTLTGAFNRCALVEATEALIAGSGERIHALVMVDVDRFKRINDQFGHGYGDRVLIKTCDALRSALRSDDLVCRIGGDEFVLLLKNILNRDVLQMKIRALCEQVRQRISPDVELTCSFGAAIYPLDGVSFEELYNKADIALYAAKEAGRNCTRVYDDEMGLPVPLFDSAAE